YPHGHPSRGICAPLGGSYINGALFTSPLPDLQSSLGYEMQISRFSRGGDSLPNNYSYGLRRIGRTSVLAGYASASSVWTTKELSSRPWFVPSWEIPVPKGLLVLPVSDPKVSCWLG